MSTALPQSPLPDGSEMYMSLSLDTRPLSVHSTPTLSLYPNRLPWSLQPDWYATSTKAYHQDSAPPIHTMVKTSGSYEVTRDGCESYADTLFLRWS